MGYLTNLPKNTIIMPMGLPACGKSTFFEYLQKRYGDNITRISFDNALEALSVKRNCSYGEAFESMRSDSLSKQFVDAHYEGQWRAAQKNGGLIFIDQTNLAKKARARLMNKLQGFHKIGIYFDITADESKRRCHERFLKTGKKIEGYVVDRMAATLRDNMPQTNEFDLLLVMDTKQHLSPYAEIAKVVKSAARGRSPHPK